MGDGVCLKRNLPAGSNEPLSANAVAQPLSPVVLLVLLKADASMAVLAQPDPLEEIGGLQISGLLWSE